MSIRLILVVSFMLPLSVFAARPASDAETSANSDYRAVQVSELSRHLGKQVRLSLPRGVVREGTLTEASPSIITVERNYGRGGMKFDVMSKQVEKAEVRD